MATSVKDKNPLVASLDLKNLFSASSVLATKNKTLTFNELGLNVERRSTDGKINFLDSSTTNLEFLKARTD